MNAPHNVCIVRYSLCSNFLRGRLSSNWSSWFPQSSGEQCDLGNGRIHALVHHRCLCETLAEKKDVNYLASTSAQQHFPWWQRRNPAVQLTVIILQVRFIKKRVEVVLRQLWSVDEWVCDTLTWTPASHTLTQLCPLSVTQLSFSSGRVTALI